MDYLIKNGRMIDPAAGTDGIADLLVVSGKIQKTGPGLSAAGVVVVDAAGKIVAPGFIDMHAHLREPGREDKETVYAGTRAAVRGGFASVCCMPNTEPAIDSRETIGLVKDICRKDAACGVYIIGAITAGRAGRELADIKGMKKEGIVGISDDGSSVADAAVMLKALGEAKREGLPVIAHCEDALLAGKGVINKGFISTKTGLRGIPREAEYGRVERDIELAAKADARLHIAHVSCRESVDRIRKAKKAAARVTAETCPHYFTLTDECCATYDTNTKMNPPLRTKDDVQAIKEGLKDGTIEVIATDHAPHTDCEKDVEFDNAPFGVIGFETALSLAAMELVDGKVLSWPELIAKLTIGPAAILGIERGSLHQGSPADICIIDPAAEWTYAKDAILSRSKNSPFIGWKLKSRVTHLFVGGTLALKDGALTL